MSGISNFKGLSANISTSCQTSTSTYFQCAAKPTNQDTDNAAAQQKTCDNCKSEYQSVLSGCTDDDYKSSQLVFSISLSCHQEGGKYCQTKTDNSSFTCDDCGKYVSKKAVQYGYFSNPDVTISEDEKKQINECATGKTSSSTTLKSMAILGLVIMSIF